MLTTIFDIETSSLNSHIGEVLSFAYMTIDDKTTKVVDSNVLYFYREGMHWSREAFEVNGLSLEFLANYRDNYVYHLQKMYKTCQKGNLVGFVSKRFDEPFIRRYLSRFMFPEVHSNRHIDLHTVFRPVFKTDVKLQSVKEKLGIEEGIINTLLNIYFKDSVTLGRAHDASYDVVVTYLLYLEAKRKGYI